MHTLGMHMGTTTRPSGPPGLLEPWNAQQVIHHLILADGATCTPLDHGSRASIHRSGGMAGEHLHVHCRLYNIANNFFAI